MRLLRSSLIAGAALMIAGCGGSRVKLPPTPALTPPPGAATVATGGRGAEGAFAQSMALRPADFPSSWLRLTSSGGTDPISALCAAPAAGGRTGRGVSDTFAATADAPRVTEIVNVYAGSNEANATLQRTSEASSCVAKAFNDGKFDRADVTFSQASAISLDVSVAGADGATGYQLTAVAQDVNIATNRQSQYLVVIAAVKGRVGVQLIAESQGQPYAPNDLRAFAEKAAAKIRQQP